MKDNAFLKVASILMILGGILATVAAVTGFMGLSGPDHVADERMPMLYTVLAVVLAASVLELIAGIQGLRACKNAALAKGCMVWGIVVAGLSIVSAVLGVVNGGQVDTTTMVLTLALPAVYVLGAYQTNKAAG